MDIDIVYTWVDDQDPRWLASKNKALTAFKQDELIQRQNNEERYRNNDELKYSLRSVEKYLPFVRRVFIVTAGQTPSWLNLHHPKIEMVAHEDIFMDKSVLPAYYSFAIESQLANIRGLAENFIYFNDDFFVCRPMKETDFFTPEGRAVIFPGERKVSKNPKHGEVAFYSGIRNANRLLDTLPGAPQENRPILCHAPYAWRKSLVLEANRVFQNNIARVSAKKFRDSGDLAVQHLYSYYALLKNAAIVSELEGHGVYCDDKGFPVADIFKTRIKAAIAYARGRKTVTIDQRIPLFLCCQNSGFIIATDVRGINYLKISKRPEVGVRELLEKWFPERSSFES